MSLIQKLNAAWQKIGVVQRALLVAIILACVIVGGVLTKWATKPDMQLLFGNLDVEQSAKITDKISEKDVLYEVRNGGRSIYVPRDKVYELRGTLAKDGLMPKTGEPGYEIFDDSKLGVSPMVQKMNYNRALQGELAKTIAIFDGIEFARIHIVRPEQTMFSDGKRASASVMIQAKPGWKVSSSTIAAISNLVSGAVEGLNPEDVTVADSSGNMLTGSAVNDTIVGGASNYKDYKASVEKDMTDRLMQSLEQVLGPNRATVLASAKLDMTRETVVSTTYEKGVPLEETLDKTTNTKDGLTDADGNATTAGTNEKTESFINKYQLPETTTTKSTVPGEVQAWSVSVIVDLTKPVDPLTETPADGENAEAASTTPKDELIMSEDDVKAIVLTAIGSDLLDDKSLTVKHVPFNRPQAIQAMTADMGNYEKMDTIIEIVRQSSMGILAVCALLVLKIFTGASKKTATAATGDSPAPLTIPGVTAALPAAAGNETIVAIRQQINTQLRQNPEQVKQLFSSWLEEDA